MPSEQAALARLTSLLEFESGTGRSGTTPEGRHRAVSYTITHLMDEEIRGRVGARRKVAYGEATEDVGEQPTHTARELSLSLAVWKSYPMNECGRTIVISLVVDTRGYGPGFESQGERFITTKIVRSDMVAIVAVMPAREVAIPHL